MNPDLVRPPVDASTLPSVSSTDTDFPESSGGRGVSRRLSGKGVGRGKGGSALARLLDSGSDDPFPKESFGSESDLNLDRVSTSVLGDGGEPVLDPAPSSDQISTSGDRDSRKGRGRRRRSRCSRNASGIKHGKDSKGEPWSEW